MSYTIKKLGIDTDQLSYINVTSITGLLDKPFLKSWSANLAVDYIENYKNQFILQLTPEIDVSLNPEMLENARNAHKQKLNETADIGSKLHALIEKFINIKLKHNNLDKNIKSIEEFESYNYFRILLKDTSYNLKQMFMQFYNWQVKNVKQFLESERPVCEQSLCYAGQLDFVYKGFDNKIYLCDFKTSNNIYKEQCLQAASYKQARESMEGEYKIYCERNGNEWTKTIHYDKIKIDEVSILNIERDNFWLDHKIVKEVDYLQQAFNYLLGFYYTFAKRRLKNIRAKERI